MRRRPDTRSPVAVGTQPGSCSRSAVTRRPLDTRSRGAAGDGPGTSPGGGARGWRSRRRARSTPRAATPSIARATPDRRWVVMRPAVRGMRMVWPTRMPAPPMVGGSGSSLARHGLGDQIGRPCVVASRQDREYARTSSKKILVNCVFVTSGPCESDAGWMCGAARSLRLGHRASSADGRAVERGPTAGPHRPPALGPRGPAVHSSEAAAGHLHACHELARRASRRGPRRRARSCGQRRGRRALLGGKSLVALMPDPARSGDAVGAGAGRWRRR